MKQTIKDWPKIQKSVEDLFQRGFRRKIYRTPAGSPVEVSFTNGNVGGVCCGVSYMTDQFTIGLLKQIAGYKPTPAKVKQSRKIPVIVAISKSSRYGRPRIIAFGTKLQDSVELAMSNLPSTDSYSIASGTLIIDPA